MLPSATSRLNFRALTAEDLPQIFRLQSDPATMAFIRAPETQLEAVVERMQFWGNYQASHPDRGVWLAEWADSGLMAGYCVLREIDWLPGNDLEIGYVVAPEYWGQGLATEMAQALSQYGFAHFEAPKLVAFIDPANAASQRVLEKCGFQVVGREQMYGSESLRLELVRQDFLYK